MSHTNYKEYTVEVRTANYKEVYVQPHGAPKWRKGLSPVKCSQTSVDGFEGQFTYRRKRVCEANKTLTTEYDVTTTSFIELLLQSPSQIVAMREGDRFIQSAISTFLSCFR